MQVECKQYQLGPLSWLVCFGNRPELPTLFRLDHLICWSKLIPLEKEEELEHTFVDWSQVRVPSCPLAWISHRRTKEALERSKMTSPVKVGLDMPASQESQARNLERI